MRSAPAVNPKVATLNAALAAAARTEVGLVFVDQKEEEQRVPLARVREHALSIAAELLDRGIRRGDRVALVLPTGAEFADVFFGVLCAGAIPVPLYPPVRLGKLDEYQQRTAAMLQSVDAALVVSNERIRRFLGVAVQRAAPGLGCVTASELYGSNAAEAKVTAGDIALIQFSSGTTRDPKPVALTHENLVFNLAAIANYVGYEEMTDPVGVSWLPLYHDMGLIGNLLSAFYGPVPLVLLPPELFVARPATWLRAISRHHGVCSAAPNFAFSLCVDRIGDGELDDVDLSSWRVCLNGAEVVSAATQRRFSERFARWGFDATAFTPCYGMAEASLGVAFKPVGTVFNTLRVDPDALASFGVVQPGGKELVSVGRPLAGVEVETRDGHSRPVPPDRVGSIFVRGPSVMLGYYGRPDLTGEMLHGGWLDTGDFGFIHDGELFICGRSKDTVIIRGANHAPQDFEAALDGLLGVRTGCTVAVGFIPDGEEEEALALLVETTRGAPLDLKDQVISRVWESTGILAAHVELLSPGTLPRTSSGKLRRSEARAQWSAGTLTPPEKVSAAQLMRHAAKGQLSHVLAAYSRRTARDSRLASGEAPLR